MLSYLHIRGLALLDDVALELGRGMNVLTGETGAGKSIIVDALALLRGARGRSELVRQGAESARVEAQFELDGPAQGRVAPMLCELGIEGGAGEGLVLERVVGRSGRGRSVVQSILTTQGVLERVGEQLIDICSQHEHHSLTHVARHLDLLDAFAGLDAEALRYGVGYQKWQAALAAEADLRRRAAEGAARAEFLRYQIEEIERLDPQPGELAGLRARVTLLRDGQRWAAFARQAHDALYEADDAIAGRLAALLDEARRGAESSALLAEIQEQLAAAQMACEEAASAASRFANELSFEPGELELAEERAHELEGLRRKHGGELDELQGKLLAMRVELGELENADFHLAALAERVRELHASCAAQAEKLACATGGGGDRAGAGGGGGAGGAAHSAGAAGGAGRAAGGRAGQPASGAAGCGPGGVFVHGEPGRAAGAADEGRVGRRAVAGVVGGEGRAGDRGPRDHLRVR